MEETKGLLGGLFKFCKKKFTADQVRSRPFIRSVGHENSTATLFCFFVCCCDRCLQGIYTPEDVVAILKESFSHVSEQWAQSHEDHSAATVATITKVPLPPQKSASASLCAHPPRQATSRIRKDVASLAAQAAELHATVSSAQALGIGGGGGGKSVADIVEMTKEIQALTKKVEKLKAQKKSQVHRRH